MAQAWVQSDSLSPLVPITQELHGLNPLAILLAKPIIPKRGTVGEDRGKNCVANLGPSSAYMPIILA